jgi:hypothetical protein
MLLAGNVNRLIRHGEGKRKIIQISFDAVAENQRFFRFERDFGWHKLILMNQFKLVF